MTKTCSCCSAQNPNAVDVAVPTGRNPGEHQLHHICLTCWNENFLHSYDGLMTFNPHTVDTMIAIFTAPISDQGIVSVYFMKANTFLSILGDWNSLPTLRGSRR